MYYIGIDLGTSAVKLMLTDGTGKAIRTVSESYPISYPHPHWSEQAPEDWWAGVCAGMERLLAGVDREQVGGVAVAGQMHGLVMLDENDRVLRPAILWNDTRTEAETRYLNEEIGRETLHARTGNIAFAGFTAPKVLWVRRHEPEIFARCARICLPKDYINLKLTGVFATDVSDASGTLYFDVERRRWSPEMLSLLGIDEGMLATVYESGDVFADGRLRAHVQPRPAFVLPRQRALAPDGLHPHGGVRQQVADGRDPAGGLRRVGNGRPPRKRRVFHALSVRRALPA